MFLAFKFTGFGLGLRLKHRIWEKSHIRQESQRRKRPHHRCPVMGKWDNCPLEIMKKMCSIVRVKRWHTARECDNGHVLDVTVEHVREGQETLYLPTNSTNIHACRLLIDKLKFPTNERNALQHVKHTAWFPERAVSGTRHQGAPRMSWIDNVLTWSGKTYGELKALHKMDR